MADQSSSGIPNLQGPEFWEMRAQVKENTRRLDAFNGKVDKIEEHIDQVRSDVRSLGEKLDGLVAGQAATLANVSSIDWKTIGTIVTLVVGPLLAAYLGTGGT